MKKIIFLIPIFFIFCLISACSQKNSYPSNNIFYFETDFQHYWTSVEQNRIFTESPNGYYCILVRNEIPYLFFINKSNMEILPLCNKPNCLHDKELDYKKRSYCNAYLTGITDYMSLGHLNGKLYIATNDYNQTSVLQIDLDGINRRELYRINGNVHGSHIIFHRGKMYISLHKYTENIDATSETWVYPLDHIGKPEKLYELSISKGRIDNFKAFGNYLYTSALLPGEHPFTRTTIFRYDLTTKELTQQFQLDDKTTVYGLTFLGEKVITNVGASLGEGSFILDMTEMQIYQTSLDGCDQNVWKETLYMPYGSDDKYFYQWNFMVSDTPEDQKELTIYDLQGKEVDRMAIGKLIPRFFTVYISPGEHVFITTFEDDVYYFPKSEIGSGNITPVLLIEGV